MQFLTPNTCNIDPGHFVACLLLALLIKVFFSGKTPALHRLSFNNEAGFYSLRQHSDTRYDNRRPTLNEKHASGEP